MLSEGFPDIDVEQCTTDALTMYEATPYSIACCDLDPGEYAANLSKLSVPQNALLKVGVFYDFQAG